MRNRIIVVVAIFCLIFFGFGAIGWAFWDPRNERSLVDFLFCYITFTSCWKMTPATFAPTWGMLLISNAVVFVYWLVYIIAAHSFVVGKSVWRQALGVGFSVLVPLAWFAQVTMVIILPNIRFG